jgi:hypothetical protein
MISVVQVVHRIMRLQPRNRACYSIYLERELLEHMPKNGISDTVNLAVAKYLKEKGKIS